MQLANYSLAAIMIATLVGFLVASEVGRWVGGLARRRKHENVSTVEGAILGLLALIVGFTFALGLSRFEAKRSAILAEANAIGTAALRAQLLLPPRAVAALELFGDYVELRLDQSVIGPHRTPEAVAGAVERSNAIQGALWRHARSLAAEDDGMVPTGLFIQSLNDMFDNQEARLAAVASGIPEIVLVALHGIALVASFFVGYAASMEQQTSRVPSYTMIVLVTGVLLIIHDLDRPRQGFITTNLQPLQNVAEGIAISLGNRSGE
jgi:uncharacterized membrane protein